jgi:hypothetical protein
MARTSKAPWRQRYAGQRTTEGTACPAYFLLKRPCFLALTEALKQKFMQRPARAPQPQQTPQGTELHATAVREDQQSA